MDRDQTLEFSATIALPDSGDLLTFHVGVETAFISSLLAAGNVHRRASHCTSDLTVASFSKSSTGMLSG